ncbi:MAG: hypothetical protein AB7W59_00065 [Acidimicrobiia bacterium]
MTTQAQFIDPALKKLLSNEDFKQRLVEYTQEYVREHMARVYDDDGVFGTSKMTLAGSAPDEITVTPTNLTIGADGRGHILDLDLVGLDTEFSGQIKTFLFENTNAQLYHISYQYAKIPRGIVINPRNGLPQYAYNIEGIGRRAEPDTVIDNGNGTLTVEINTACDGAGHSYAGRRVLVFLKTPNRDAILESIALQTATITWNGVNNRATVNGLGQAVISTTPSDYEVVVLGPTVSKSDTTGLGGHLYIGSIVGAGAGNTAGAGSNTNQNLIDTSLSSFINYPGGPSWADGTANGPTTIINQLSKIVADLTSTTGQRGAGKLTSPALSSWADATTNPATRLDLQLDKIITDLATTAGSGGAARVGIGARTAWLGGRTNPATTVFAAIDKIITDLAGQNLNDDGAERIGIASRTSWLGGRTNPFTTVYAAIDKIITDLAATAAADDGAERIGAQASGNLNAGSVRSQLDELDAEKAGLDLDNTFIGENSFFDADVSVGQSLINLGSQLLGNEAAGLIARLHNRMVQSTVGERTLLWEAEDHASEVFPHGHFRLYASHDDNRSFEITVNARWDGANWNKDNTTDRACKWAMSSEGRFRMFQRISGGGTWTDAGWSSETFLFHNDAGNGTLTLQNPRIAFENLTTHSNPNSFGAVSARVLYGMNILDCWVKGISNGGSADDSFGLTSIVAAGSGATVTFQHSTAGGFQQAIVATGSGTSATDARYMTVSTFGVNSIVLRAWRWNGAAIAEHTLGDWSLMRFARLAA